MSKRAIKKEFFSFLESIETPRNKELLNYIREGFDVCMEGEGRGILESTEDEVDEVRNRIKNFNAKIEDNMVSTVNTAAKKEKEEEKQLNEVTKKIEDFVYNTDIDEEIANLSDDEMHDKALELAQALEELGDLTKEPITPEVKEAMDEFIDQGRFEELMRAIQDSYDV